VLQCVAVCRSVLQCVAVCCIVWQRIYVHNVGLVSLSFDPSSYGLFVEYLY